MQKQHFRLSTSEKLQTQSMLTTSLLITILYLSLFTRVNSYQKKKCLDYTNANWVQFKKYINNNTVHTPINSSTDIYIINNINELIPSSVEQHIPKKNTVCSTTSNLPSYIFLLIRLKNYLRRLSTKNSGQPAVSLLKQLFSLLVTFLP